MSEPILLLLSGPNLNLLGEREPETYGDETLEEHVEAAKNKAAESGFIIEHFQSNHEGEIVDSIHAARNRCSGIIINPGAFTHYAWSIHDALSSFEGPVIELHISNPASREPWRHSSVVAPVSSGTIAGFGAKGYQMAIDAIVGMIE